MYLRRAPEKYITGAALDRAGIKAENISLSATEHSTNNVYTADRYGHLPGWEWGTVYFTTSTDRVTWHAPNYC
jgi:hypothetical protein